MTIVLKVLKEYHESDSLPSFHYNNMLEELQNVAPDITEETLLQHGEFIVQQVLKTLLFMTLLLNSDIKSFCTLFENIIHIFSYF